MEKYVLTAEEEQFIVDNYYSMTAREIAETIGCNINKVCNTWVKHGLSGKISRLYPIKNEDIFSKIDNPTSAYYVGLIASDGCLYDKKGRGSNIVRISLQKEDEDILKRFAKDLGTNKSVTYSSGKYANFEISSNKMFDDLVKIGLGPNKTYKNTVPDIDYSVMRYFIRGYFDGDGSISCNIEKISDVAISISGYENNLLKIKKYLESVNILSSFCEDKRFYNKGNGRFGSLTIGNLISKYSFIKHIYEDDDYPVLQRKKAIADNFIKIIESNNDVPRYKLATIYYNHAVQKVC